MYYWGKIMSKKVIGIFIIVMMTTPVFGSLVIAENLQVPTVQKNAIDYSSIDSEFESIGLMGSSTQISSTGPVSPMLNIAEIIIIAGPFFRTFIIRLILVSMKAYFLLPDISIPINDLTFAIRYKKNVDPFPSLEGFSYNTTIIENETTTTYTNKHLLLVTGFDGTFGFSRADMVNLVPAKFSFEGTCDGALVAT
jgi:hypothetical protein